MEREQMTAEQKQQIVEHFQLFEKASKSLFKKYDAAIKEMKTRFEILDADLEYRFNRNPIHHMESRLKTPKSVFEKLQRYEVPITLQSVEEHILDVAGMRVIVSYIDDVYAMVKVLSMQDDLKIVKVKDYIKNPKPNGYRSLHVIVKVPVYFLDRKQYVPVEIQFRTVAMDFWASLEHTLKYKQDVQLEGIDMFDELKTVLRLLKTWNDACKFLCMQFRLPMSKKRRASEENNSKNRKPAWQKLSLLSRWLKLVVKNRTLAENRSAAKLATESFCAQK